MDARTLNSKMDCCCKMERRARLLLIEEGLATTEEVALMTSIDVCTQLLEKYEVVSCEDENITIVKREDMDTYLSITRSLCG